MQKLVIVALAIIGLAVAIPFASHQQALDAFEDFKVQYGKIYTPKEYALRFRNFLDNAEKIEKMNAGQSTATFGINEFSDLSLDEFRKIRTGAPNAGPIYTKSCLAEHAYKDLSVLPAPKAGSCDWTKANVITAVKNQEDCGSCWAFATACAIETAYAIRVSGKAISLSEEQIVDCSTACSYEIFQGQNVSVCNSGCGGGWPWMAFADINVWGGLMTETVYPYNDGGNTCPSSWPGALTASLDKTKPFTCLSTPGGAPADETKMATWVSTQGPVAIALDATPLQSYTGGILVPDNQTVSCAEYALDHAVTVVGYNDNNNPPYWIVRNSWGNTWGEAGYFRIAKGVGACGMTNAVTAANLKGNPKPKVSCPSA